MSDDDKTAIVGGTFSKQLEKASDTPPTLVMLVGPPGYVGRQWPIEGEGIIIGRSMTSAIFVDDRSVSRSHTKLSNFDGEVTLVDLDSSNKTIINGKPIPPFAPFKLKNDDQVKVGNVLFKYLEAGSIEAAANLKLNTKSDRDPLTGAWNKGALLVKGPEYFERAKAMSVPLSLLIFDIDHFKKINDNYSHAAGDLILKELAQIISHSQIRGDDFFARFGGEEFVIILNGSNIHQAEEIGERIRHKVENYSFLYKDQKIPVTVSIGVVQQNEEMQSWDVLFEMADQALYKSKRTGRNKVTVL